MPSARGSERLMETRPLTSKQLESIAALAKKRGVRVRDWLILGQPAPDSVSGTLEVSAGQAAGLVAEILRLRDLRPRLEIFPLGIPNPNLFNVRVRF